MHHWPYFKENNLLNLLILSIENLKFKLHIRQKSHFKDDLSGPRFSWCRASTSSHTVCISIQLVPGGLSMVQGVKDNALQELEDEENAEVDSEEHACILKGILQVTSDVWGF